MGDDDIAPWFDNRSWDSLDVYNNGGGERIRNSEYVEDEDRRNLSGFEHLWDTNMRACHYPNNDTIIYTKGSVEGGRYMVDNQYFVCLDGNGLLEDAESHIDDELSSMDEFRRSKAQDSYLEFLGQPRNIDIYEVTATDVSEGARDIKRVNPGKPSQDIDSYVNEIERARQRQPSQCCFLKS
jgi:hypothetical protein